jgi:2-polyprenyl-3-methyl-5-hydroxy-6-metoxy-1,4-benzoquinol methylase
VFMGLKNKIKKLLSISSHDISTRYQGYFDNLRNKWHEVPAGDSYTVTTKQLLDLSNQELLDLWERIISDATTGPAFNVRGWYHLIYKDILRGKRVIDVGCGLGIDGITFAKHGARMTFVDIVESNLEVLKRLCRLLDLKDIDFYYMDDISSLSGLPTDYDVIWCQGSLIHVPFKVVYQEAQELLKHLVIGGRWIELAYPKERWEREGRMPFKRWGKKTDRGAPWAEWYDLDKIMARLSPAKFDVVLHFNFHNDKFNWFDLIRKA